MDGESFSALRRCLLLSAFLGSALAGTVAMAGAGPECPFDRTPPKSDVLIAYVGEARETTQGDLTAHIGPIRALALIRQGKLAATDGRFIREGMPLWRVLSPKSSPVTLRNVSSFLDHMGEDHCVYHAEMSPSKIPQWTLLASKPIGHVFRSPRPQDISFFRKHNSTCVDQGDYDPSEKPPCTRPRLLAVSDIDRDGDSEYWATEPYTWDTGITVWKQVGDSLVRLLDVCSGCSD